MIDWNKRCKELKALMDEHGIKILASGWFRHQIIFQEQSMIAKLEADKAELLETLKRTNGALSDMQSELYGQNLKIIGWHLNGNEEPVENFFDNNWEPDLDLNNNKQLIQKMEK